MSRKCSRDELLEAVNSGFDSKTEAKKRNVPASTIRRHHCDRTWKPRIGRPAYLTIDEKSYVVSILQLLPDCSFNLSREVALQLANDYCQSFGSTYYPDDKWLGLFMKKHTNDIKWKRQKKMESNRATAFSEEVCIGWLCIVKDILSKYNLFDKPHQVFKIDETVSGDKTRADWF
jgi:hypothetical protein